MLSPASTSHINNNMKLFFIKIKMYILAVYRIVTRKRSVVIYINKDDTFGLTFFNMSEEETRQYLFLTYEHFAYKHIVKYEIERMTK